MKLSALFAFASTFAAASALPVTGTTGGGAPFDNRQPTLAVTQLIANLGVFPSGGGGGSASGDTIGFIYNFAGGYIPGNVVAANGQSLSIQNDVVLFQVLGTMYGGDGINSFNVPNLVGKVVVGTGSGPGLSSYSLNQQVGSPTVSLNVSQIPAHNHTLPGGGVTGTTGGGQPFDNRQPTVALHALIATNAPFASPNVATGSIFLGQIAYFAGDFVPGGWTEAAGQLLPIQGNTALFSEIGTTYGGDGVHTFALPDLRGRVAVGSGGNVVVGQQFGQESTTLSSSQLPAHDHTLPGGGHTGTTGGNLPFNNDQPSVAINYLIAVQGAFPTIGGGGPDPSVPMLGEIVPFAGNYAPAGWALADGQLLSIQQNTALFSIMGTEYGGDGINTFALPDLRGRTLTAADMFDNVLYPVGQVYGSDTNTLSIANLPAHDHTLPATPTGVPEPLSLGLMVGGLAGLGALRRRSRG